MPTTTAQERPRRTQNPDVRYRNVTLDREVHEQLVAAQGKLAKELGFEPTLSQTLRALIKRAAV
jgi:hypothetical protein